jgi:hypothetical protein
MEKHEETRYVKRTQKITQCLLNYKLFKKLRTTYSYNPQRLMAFKIELLLNGSENSVTLIGKTKHHLLCQSHGEQKIMELEQSKTSRETESFWNDRLFADKKQSF